MQAETIVHAGVLSIAIAGLSLIVLSPSSAQGQNKAPGQNSAPVQSSAQGPTKTLNAVFTPTSIAVDGAAEEAWSKATPSDIAICMDSRRTAPKDDCTVAGNVRALWNGPLLYLLFTVTDPNVDTSAGGETARSGVQVYVDHFDDKFPKFEEDDGYFVVSAAGQQTGNNPNANLPYYPTVWATHLKSYAAAPRMGPDGSKIGYTVEVAWAIGDLPLKNGTKLGMEFVINAIANNAANPAPAAPAAPGNAATGKAGPGRGFGAGKGNGNANQYLLSWSSATNKGVNDNTMWGDVVLAGYDGKASMALNTFPLKQNIQKATPAETSDAGLVRGIWKDEMRVDRALAAAKTALEKSKSQREIDAANTALDTALKGLRRSGKYPDPFDLPALGTLPDPFTFFNGSKVRTKADWDKRRAEIRDLAEYYEYGEMPAKPKSFTAIATETDATTRTIAVTMEDRGRMATFSPVLHLPSSGTAPYPVIVEQSFRAAGAPNRAYTDGGYAVLSIPTGDIASDNAKHTGAFYELYPYKLDREGDDRSVLLGWAWGASRGVDALEYLAAHDPAYAKLIDLKKLVVTGFSRWGKAALVAGFLDDRFMVTAPGGSGSGGAAPYRYDSYGNEPARDPPYGNDYPWGHGTGSEMMGDHIRHQTHNSNEMIRRFLNEPRIYKTSTHGYGERLPYDHHSMIAAIAPRAIIIINTNDDYNDNAEGDSIGYEGAKPVYQFLGAPQNLALDIFMGGGGHSLKPSQAANVVTFSNFVLFGKPMPEDVRKHLTTDPYLDAGTYDRYYGGLKTMMPWGSEKR